MSSRMLIKVQISQSIADLGSDCTRTPTTLVLKYIIVFNKHIFLIGMRESIMRHFVPGRADVKFGSLGTFDVVRLVGGYIIKLRESNHPYPVTCKLMVMLIVH